MFEVERSIASAIGEAGGVISSYGSLYENSATFLELTDADTYYKWASTTIGEEKGAGYVVGSASTDNLTIGASGAGKYKVNFNMNYDTTHGVSNTAAVHVDNVAQDPLTMRKDAGAFPVKFPDSFDVVLGTLNSGTVDTLQFADANYVDVQEIVGDTGFIIDHTFSNIFDPHAACYWGIYEGGLNHEVEVMVRNYATTIDEVQNGGNGYTCIRSHISDAAKEPGVGADWAAYWSLKGAASGEAAWVTATAYVDGFDDLRAGTSDIPISTTDIFREWPYPAATSPYVNSGASIVRFLHTSSGTASHKQLTDKLCIEDNHISTMISGSGVLDLSAGQVVDLRIKSNIGGENIHIHTANLNITRIG